MSAAASVTSWRTSLASDLARDFAPLIVASSLRLVICAACSLRLLAAPLISCLILETASVAGTAVLMLSASGRISADSFSMACEASVV